jgi:hypothetical protein
MVEFGLFVFGVLALIDLVLIADIFSGFRLLRRRHRA